MIIFTCAFTSRVLSRENRIFLWSDKTEEIEVPPSKEPSFSSYITFSTRLSVRMKAAISSQFPSFVQSIKEGSTLWKVKILRHQCCHALVPMSCFLWIKDWMKTTPICDHILSFAFQLLRQFFFLFPQKHFILHLYLFRCMKRKLSSGVWFQNACYHDQYSTKSRVFIHGFMYAEAER